MSSVKLWLIWQNPSTRQRYHIGDLIRFEDGYTFKYVHCGHRTLPDAVKNGYIPHLAFPDTSKTYLSKELFGSFSRRLPDRRRPDYKVIINELGLPLDHSEMDLLKVTGGRLATDSYEFVMPIHVQDHCFHFDFFVAGWRYYDGEKALNELETGDKVTFSLEPGNEQDPFAVAVYSKSGYKLGYTPAFYSEFLHTIIKGDKKYSATIESFNEYARPQLKVYISVTGTLSDQDKDIFSLVPLGSNQSSVE